MKNAITLFAIIICCALPSSLIAQKVSADDLLNRISNKWQQQDETVFVQRIIELDSLEKDLIYNRVLEFLTNAYKDANEVIQVKEKENGLIIGKGNSSFYVNEVFAGSAIKQTIWHIFKAEVKDNKVRITISVDAVNWHSPASTAAGIHISAKDGFYPITNCYPIGAAVNKKKRDGFVFYYSINGIIELLDSCEAFLKSKTSITTDSNW